MLKFKSELVHLFLKYFKSTVDVLILKFGII